MSAVEFSPQSAGVINVEQSEAARAKDTDIGATTISAKAATLHNRMVDFLVLIRVYWQVGGDGSRKRVLAAVLATGASWISFFPTLPLDHAFRFELADVGPAAIEVHRQCRRADGCGLSGSRSRGDGRAIIGDGLSHRVRSCCAAVGFRLQRQREAGL